MQAPSGKPEAACRRPSDRSERLRRLIAHGKLAAATLAAATLAAVTLAAVTLAVVTLAAVMLDAERLAKGDSASGDSASGSSTVRVPAAGHPAPRLPSAPSEARLPTSPRFAGTFAVAADAPAIPTDLAVRQLGVPRPAGDGPIQLCQAWGPCREGVDCRDGCCSDPLRWHDRRVIPWEMLAQGEYIGPVRAPHVPVYQLRVDDQLDFVYRLTRTQLAAPYELNVGDEVRVESLADAKIDRTLLIQPDGNITLRMLGQVRAAGRTVEELTKILEDRYREYYKVPSITVTPLKVNARLEDLRSSIDNRYGRGGQSFATRVSPDGTVQLPGLGSVPVVGLTLDELKREVDERYRQVVRGIEVTPVLVQRAPRYVYVLGEVPRPGRFELEGPTSLMQALALAGGWRNGGNLRHIVVFRRTEDWRLLATKLDMWGPLYGRRPCPADEIWLRDRDVIVVPQTPVRTGTDFIELVFTRGIYGILPVNVAVNVANASTL